MCSDDYEGGNVPTSGVVYASQHSVLASTTYTVDTAGRVTRITDLGGHVSSYTYDLAGRRTVSVDADAGTTTTTFDDDDNPVTSTTATDRMDCRANW